MGFAAPLTARRTLDFACFGVVRLAAFLRAGLALALPRFELFLRGHPGRPMLLGDARGYAPLPAVVSARDAFEKDAPQLYDDLMTRRCSTTWAALTNAASTLALSPGIKAIPSL